MIQYFSRTFSDIWADMVVLLRPTFLRPGEKYSWGDFRADAIAGVTVAIIQIPQSMGLALIAGLPAVYGLYASLPGFIASLWGSSRHLSTGPVAIVSFLTLTSIVPLAAPGSPEFIAMAATLALLVGIIYFLMGIFRMGAAIQFVPHSVIEGFSSAGAVMILVSQIPTFLGLSIHQYDTLIENILEILFNLGDLSWLSLIVGVVALILLFLAKRLPKTFPGALVVLAFGILVAYIFHLGAYGIPLVRTVPSSLPFPMWPALSPIIIFALLPKAGIIALVGFVGAHASAKTAARKTKEHLDTNQELVGQGLANIVTGFFQGFPLSGSFTRTALNVEVGARTPLASVITSVVTVLVLLLLSPIFYYLPRAVLAAIIILAALPLIDVRRMRAMYNISATDGFVAFLTFGLAFFLKPSDAIFIGIVAALILFVRQTVIAANVIEMGVDRELKILRGSIEEAHVDTFPSVCIARVTMSIYYANAGRIVSEMDAVIAKHVLREGAPVKSLVLDASAVNFTDITGIEVMKDYFENLRERGIGIYIIYLRTSLRESLERVPDFPAFKVFRNIDDLRSTLWLAHK